MRIVLCFSLFFFLFGLLFEAQAASSAFLHLRGRVYPFTDMQTTKDGIWVSSNDRSNILIRLNGGGGRSPASVISQGRTYIDKTTLIKDGVYLIQVEAP